jgi:hypothetical protein
MSIKKKSERNCHVEQYAISWFHLSVFIIPSSNFRPRKNLAIFQQGCIIKKTCEDLFDRAITSPALSIAMNRV